jgi:NADH-quinone oxidoreductase subunit N
MPHIPYIPGSAELRPFAADICLVVSIVAVLLTPFFTRKSNIACGLVTLVGLSLALLAQLGVANAGDPPAEYFRGMLVSDPLAIFFKAILIVFTFFVVLMWFAASARQMHEGDGPEFFTLLLGAALGMSLMSETSNLLMIFIAIELASLPSYVLAGFRKSDRLGAEASLKYVLFGASASAIMVYGLSLLYGLYGSLSIPEISAKIAANGMGSPALLAVGILTLLAGIGFKISAVPFHFWCPDVFEGAGIDVAAFLSVASKGAGLTLLLRIMVIFAGSLGYAPAEPLVGIATAVGILGAITCTVGNTAAFRQNNIKRLLAYSSIAHAGYMLCALAVIAGNSALNSSAAQALLFYLAVYLFMNLGAFTVAALVSKETHGENLEDFAGLGKRSPALAVCMAIFMFSLIGIPPFAGFAAKLNIMILLARAGGFGWPLLAIIGLNTIFSLYYYARVIKAMFLENSPRPAFVPGPLGMGICVMSAVALLVMFVGYSPLLNLAGQYSQVYQSPPPVQVATAAP